jgi:tetratricopeptide (TPR) repeat protein
MTDLCKKSLDVNYYGDNGSIFARFAEATEQLDTSETGRLAARKILEEGIAKFPASQDITIGLINNYNKGGEDSDKVFQLLDRAKANDPTNASLYSFTGEVLAQVGRYDDAVKTFNDCIAKFPDYEWGYIGMGNLYAKISNEANEKMNDSSLDNNAYNKLFDEKVEAIKGCIENYEKAFELTKDEALKANLASSLKSNNFMLRDEDPKYMAAYEKYKAYEEGVK